MWSINNGIKLFKKTLGIIFNYNLVDVERDIIWYNSNINENDLC